MNPLEESTGFANQIIPLAQRLLTNHQPGAQPSEQPEFHEIRSLLEQAQQMLRGGLNKLLSDLQSQGEQARAKAEEMRAQQKKTLTPKPPPPPLLALEHEAKYTPDESEIQPKINHLVAMSHHLHTRPTH